jgi:hypothetical protein
LNSNRATIGRNNKTAIEKLGEILCIELAKGGGDRERAKVWKKRET